MQKVSEKYFQKFADKPIKDLLKLDNRTLNTLMLELYDKRSKDVKVEDILNKYIDNYEFFGPSKAELREKNEYEKLFLDCLPSKYDALELSPIGPFGGNSCFTNLSQKNILSTVKNSEVCSDATTALTLEACKRRKEIIKNPEDINKEVNLATSKKVLRMQRFEQGKGYLQHFGQFAAITAGRKSKDFEYQKLKEHIELWVTFLLKLVEEGYSLGKINVGLSNISIIEHFINNGYIDKSIITSHSFSDFDLFKELNIDLPKKLTNYGELTDRQINIYQLNQIKKYIINLSEMINDLNKKYADVNFYVEMDRKGGLGYYTDSCFHIYSCDENATVPLCDGGMPDWNGKILRDSKESSIVSGVGSELILNLYKKRR